MSIPDKVLLFPDRSVLKLIEAVGGVLTGECTPEKALAAAEDTMRAIGAVKDANGKWQLPESAQS